MPAHVPISSIISMSKFVRDSRRCASSNFPELRSSTSRSASSARIAPTARSSVGRVVMKCFAG
jgi:hypothetical protein